LGKVAVIERNEFLRIVSEQKEAEDRERRIEEMKKMAYQNHKQ